MILRQVGVHDPARTAVDEGLLLQGERQSPDHAAIILALDKTGIDESAGGEGPDETGRPNDAQVGVDLHLRENGAVGIHRPGASRLLVADHATHAHQGVAPGPPENIHVAFAPRLVIAPVQASAAGDHADIAGAKQRRRRIAAGKLRQLANDVL